MSYQTIQVRFKEPACFLQIHRPEANNTINDRLIAECNQVLAQCEESTTIVVLEGLPEVFCFGADFQGIRQQVVCGQQSGNNSEPVYDNSPGPVYDLWLKMATGPYITISHVRGKANAGGMGFVGASDIVLADESAQFSLSELLFGLFPACVLPFLIRRLGFQRAHYMTLMTQPISVEQAYNWGLVDAYAANSGSLLRKHLLRLRYLSKTGIMRYKRYMSKLHNWLVSSKSSAVAANQEVFSDIENLEKISRFVKTGQFPWEK